MPPSRPILLALVLAFGTAIPVAAKDLQTAIFAGGCFWCIEADFESVPGVVEAVSGFTAGRAATATYKMVSKGNTKHVEAVEITFDADKVSYDTLIDIFWRTIDPTDAGGQFCDRGNSYRAAVFVMNPAQKASAQASKAAAQSALGQKIVTPILQAVPFYPSEAYHQNYYKQSKRVLTRYGFIPKKRAYKKYRKACGRDTRVKELWGKRAFVVAGS